MSFGDDTLDPANQPEPPLLDKRDTGKRTYKRQLVLLDVIENAQRECQHTLFLGEKLIVCTDCGALWLR